MKEIVMANGQKLALEGDPVVNDYLNRDSSQVGTLLYQINDTPLYSQFFDGKSNLTLLDLGSNIGLVSLYAAPVCDRIVAVEPSPMAFEVLSRLCKPFPKIEPLKVALAPKAGPCSFKVNDVNSTANSTVQGHGTEIQVEGDTLSGILKRCNLTHVDICKVDVEGAEGKSLPTAQLEAAKPIIHAYYIEAHNCPETSWQEKIGALVVKLTRLGYSRITIDQDKLWASQP